MASVTTGGNGGGGVTTGRRARFRRLLVHEAARRQWVDYHRSQGAFAAALLLGWVPDFDEEQAVLSMQRLLRASRIATHLRTCNYEQARRLGWCVPIAHPRLEAARRP